MWWKCNQCEENKALVIAYRKDALEANRAEWNAERMQSIYRHEMVDKGIQASQLRTKVAELEKKLAEADEKLREPVPTKPEPPEHAKCRVCGKEDFTANMVELNGIPKWLQVVDAMMGLGMYIHPKCIEKHKAEHGRRKSDRKGK